MYNGGNGPLYTGKGLLYSQFLSHCCIIGARQTLEYTLRRWHTPYILPGICFTRCPSVPFPFFYAVISQMER